MVRRGEIFYIKNSDNDTDPKPSRPAVIVSNNKCNTSNSYYFEVVFLTTQTKHELPTHVEINSTGKLSVALCESINSVHRDRIGDYVGMCTDDEINRIDNALMISLGLEDKGTNICLPPPSENDEFRKLLNERDFYRKMYTDLLERIINR